MSKIDELIQEYCPDGVEWTNLDSVCIITKGVQFNKSNMASDGTYPVINGGITPSGYIEQYNQDANTITISQGGASAGYVNWLDTKFWAGAHCYIIKPTENVLNRYLYHFLKNKETKLQECQYGAGIPALAKSTISELTIPLPPLPVQKEIVRILDQFTNLSAELKAELKARKEQFQYYIDYYMGRSLEDIKSKASSMDVRQIKDLGTLQRGKRFVHADDRPEGQPSIHYGDLYTYYGISAKESRTHLDYDFPKKLRYAEKGDVVIVGAGENDWDIGVGLVWEGDEPAAVHDACYTLKHNYNSKYIAYYLRSTGYHLQLKQKVSTGKICSVSADGVGDCWIPIPNIEEQERIANILDSFNTLTTDLSQGLPAEIEAREKQYQYYRDKLLSFNEKEG